MTDPHQPSAFVGCDVGKTSIAVFDTDSGQTRLIANEPEPLAELAASIDAGALVICEATGGYETALLHAMFASGRAVHRADARKVKAFVRSFGTLGKTDAIDARALARYGEERHQQLQRWQPAEESRLALQALVLARRDLVADRLAWRNRRQAPGAEMLRDLLDPLCDLLDEQIRKADDAIARLIEADRSIERDIKTLRSIKCLGPVTAAALIALMPELGSLGRRQAAALAGLAPHPNQSGERNGYRRVRGGRPEVKRVLFMAALSAAQWNPELKAFYQRLLGNGKKPIVALTAVMRKLVILCNARLRDAAVV